MGYYDHASMMILQLGHWHPNHGNPNQKHSRQGVTLHQASLHRTRLLTAPAQRLAGYGVWTRIRQRILGFITE
jgi:hypothetical protein